MEFDESKVINALHYQDAKVGMKGYFSDYLNNLRDYVKCEEKIMFDKLIKINAGSLPFIKEKNKGSYQFFYPVELPELPEKTENKKPVIYISGKITGDDNYREKFAAAEKMLSEKGFNVINPCRACEYDFFTYEQFMHVDFALIDAADTIYMLSDWEMSKGATAELHYAEAMGKAVLYQRSYEMDLPPF